MQKSPLFYKLTRFLSYPPGKRLRAAKAWIRRCFIRIRFRLLPHRPAIARLGWGRFEIPDDWVGVNVFDGSYDRPVLQCLARLLTRESVCVDAGANLGYYSIYLEKHCGCRVFAFEPSPREFSRLLKNLALNHSASIKAERLGLGDCISRVDFFISNLNTGANSLIRHSNDMERIEIDVVTLDSYIDRNRIAKVDMLKIDVEGWEHAVLKGADNVIEKFHPAVFYETWHLPGKSFFEVKQACPATGFLQGKGYDFYLIDDNAVPQKMEDDMGTDRTILLAVYQHRLPCTQGRPHVHGN